MATKGKAVGLVLLALLPAFIVACAWMFLDGLRIGEKQQAAMGFIGVIFFGVCAMTSASSKKYIPGKTFQAYRNKKFSTQRAINYGYGVVVFIVAVFAALNPEVSIKVIGFGFLAILSLYALSKSLKFHEDIDFSTNQYLAVALGFSMGEKILLSYQNFCADEVENGSNAFAVTATKLIVASFDGEAWKKLSRELNQVSHIGVIGDENQNYFVKLKFSDGADVLLRIGLYEKLTSNPILVIRKLLEAVDASLLDSSGVAQAVRRRRVVVSSGIQASDSVVVAPGVANASMTPLRNIELSPEVLISIQNATEVVAGRRLEL